MKPLAFSEAPDVVNRQYIEAGDVIPGLFACHDHAC